MQYSSLKMLLSSRLYANYVLLMISFIYFSNQLCRYLYSSVRIPFIDYEGSEYASLAGPVFTLCYTFSGIGVGYVADLPTVSRVKLLLCFFTGWILVTASVSTTTTYTQVALTRLLQGLLEAGCTPFAVSLLADTFNPTERGRVLALYNTAIYVGYSAALSTGALLMDAVGWQGAFFLPSFSCLVMLPVMACTLTEPIRRSSYAMATDSLTSLWAILIAINERKTLSFFKDTEKCITSIVNIGYYINIGGYHLGWDHLGGLTPIPAHI